MKVLVLNGSPRVEKSNTQRILRPLIGGMRKAGAEVEHRYLAKLTINPCLGCFRCWVQSAGRCHAHRDDMDELLPLHLGADILVLGFPLYFFTFPALVKNMLERLLPAGMPWLVPHPAEPQLITHPPRDDKTRRLFIVSTAGLPGRQHFYSLVQTARQIALMAHIEYAGHILCPAAEALRIKTLWFKQRPFFNAVRQAGIDLVREGSLSEQTQKRLEAELMPGGDQAYIERANAYWIERMARHDITAEPPPEAPLPKKYRRTTG